MQLLSFLAYWSFQIHWYKKAKAVNQHLSGLVASPPEVGHAQAVSSWLGQVAKNWRVGLARLFYLLRSDMKANAQRWIHFKQQSVSISERSREGVCKALLVTVKVFTPPKGCLNVGTASSVATRGFCARFNS